MTGSAPESSDEALAARAVAGDDSAFEALVVRYQPRLFRLASRLTSETDAPDVVQEAFLQAHRHLPTFRGEARIGTWLYRIATNAALMHRRARARRPADSLEPFLPRFDAEGRLEETPEALRVAARVDELLDRQALAAKARAAIERLPDLYREAFVLRDLEELTTADVAQVLAVDPATVRQRVHRARLMVRGYPERARRRQAMTDVVCRSGVELLMEYMEGELAPDVRAAIEAHVAGCPRCEAFIASYRETPRIVREASRVEMPADLEASLLQALRAARDERDD